MGLGVVHKRRPHKGGSIQSVLWRREEGFKTTWTVDVYTNVRKFMTRSKFLLVSFLDEHQLSRALVLQTKTLLQ